MSGFVAEPTDDALVRAARLGDEDAFAVIVDRYGPGMYRYAVRLVGSEERCRRGDPGGAGVCLEGPRHVRRALQPARRGCSGWSTAGPPTCNGTARRSRSTTTCCRRMVRPAQDNPLQQVLDAELLAALQVALAELPWHQRAAWLLREVEEMSYDEIAVTLGVSEGSVRGHLHRGRRTLAERMARWR